MARPRRLPLLNPSHTIPPLPHADLGLLRVAAATWPEALAFTESLLGNGHGRVMPQPGRVLSPKGPPAPGRLGDAAALKTETLRGHYFCFCEASLLSNLVIDPSLRTTLASATAVFPDGVALMRLARLHGHSLPSRVPGPSFLLAACEYGVQRGWRHFFYGGAPGVPERLAARLTQDYPGIAIVGTHSPPFGLASAEQERQEKEMIEAAQPDLLWVCLGSPKQERWCADHVGKIKVPLMLPVGAAFDFHAGSRPWAPPWVRRVGCEWVFRTFTGGRRTFLRNLRCVAIVAAYLARVALQRRLQRLPGNPEISRGA